MAEALFPRVSIVHMFGKGGDKIWKLEEHFGERIGVQDSTED